MAWGWRTRRTHLLGVLTAPEAKQRSLADHRGDDAEAQRGPKKELMREKKVESKSELARQLGVSRASLYYLPKKEKQDWSLKARIEEVLREHPSYGSRRLALHLKLNRKRLQRVMRRFGIKPHRRLGKKWLNKKPTPVIYANLLMTTMPSYQNHVWAADFIELRHQNKRVYVATVEDLYTRKIVGVSVALRKGVPLTLQALHGALLHQPHPTIFHSDNTLGELVVEVYRLIWVYHNTRIHSALKMPPAEFEKVHKSQLSTLPLSV